MTNTQEILFSLSNEEKERAKNALWERACQEISACRACGLASTRTNVVFGDGRRVYRFQVQWYHKCALGYLIAVPVIFFTVAFISLLSGK